MGCRGVPWGAAKWDFSAPSGIGWLGGRRSPPPAGGGIALMVHALMWCACVLGIRSRMPVSVMAPVARFLALTLGASSREPEEPTHLLHYHSKA